MCSCKQHNLSLTAHSPPRQLAEARRAADKLSHDRDLSLEAETQKVFCTRTLPPTDTTQALDTIPCLFAGDRVARGVGGGGWFVSL